MVRFNFHIGHVVFSNSTNLSKWEHDICHISFDEVNHWYKQTNGISKNQYLHITGVVIKILLASIYDGHVRHILTPTKSLF